MRKHETDFTQGKIAGPLVRFAIPVLLALFLQAMYGAVDLLIVGKFAKTIDVSAVATGSHVMHSITFVIASFAMGLTVLLGQMIGEGKKQQAGEVMGAAIPLFTVIGVVISALVAVFAEPLSELLRAPEKALAATTDYVRICGIGFIVIIAYNLIGSIFRGIGDSNTPLIAVAIACVLNILGDLLLVAVFGLGAAGAAIATVFSELVSVLVSLVLIKRRKLPFDFNLKMIRFRKDVNLSITKLGIPLALQEFLVSASFLVI